MTRFQVVKVEEHSGEPLSEAAHALSLAGAAAEIDPTRPADVGPEGVQVHYSETLVAWSAGLRRHLTQAAASQRAAKGAQPVRRPDGASGAPSAPLTTARLLRPLQGRRTLGDALSRARIAQDREKMRTRKAIESGSDAGPVSDSDSARGSPRPRDKCCGLVRSPHHSMSAPGRRMLCDALS